MGISDIFPICLVFGGNGILMLCLIGHELKNRKAHKNKWWAYNLILNQIIIGSILLIATGTFFFGVGKSYMSPRGFHGETVTVLFIEPPMAGHEKNYLILLRRENGEVRFVESGIQPNAEVGDNAEVVFDGLFTVEK